MEGINEAVLKQLAERKGGSEIRPLWDDLWRAYESAGTDGVSELINSLLDPAVRRSEADD